MLTIDHNSARLAGELDTKLRSNPIHTSDLLIAAIAIGNMQTLLTSNLKHFQRILSLEIESW